MFSWNFVIAAVFVFLAAMLLASAVDMLGDAQRAQILVAPDFGQLADQAWDTWRSRLGDFFRFLEF